MVSHGNKPSWKYSKLRNQNHYLNWNMFASDNHLIADVFCQQLYGHLSILNYRKQFLWLFIRLAVLKRNPEIFKICARKIQWPIQLRYQVRFQFQKNKILRGFCASDTVCLYCFLYWGLDIAHNLELTQGSVLSLW